MASVDKSGDYLWYRRLDEDGVWRSYKCPVTCLDEKGLHLDDVAEGKMGAPCNDCVRGEPAWRPDSKEN